MPAALQGNGRFVLLRRSFVPAYVKTCEEGQLKEKAQEALELLHSCTICPRECEANRCENEIGMCKIGRWARVSSAFAHRGEEDCLCGRWRWRGKLAGGGLMAAGCD